MLGRTVDELRHIGAEVLDCSLIVGETAYEVVPGFLAAPIGPPSCRSRAEVAARFQDLAANPEASHEISDEELFAHYLARKLEG